MFKRSSLLAVIGLCLLISIDQARAQEDHPASTGAHAPAMNQAHATGEAAVMEGHGEEAKAPLLPKLDDPQTWWSAFWVVLIFVILLAVLYPTAWKNVLAGLKAREQRIRKDIADAEAARGRAEATLKEYTAQLAAAEARAQEMISKAAGEGERLAATIKTRAEQEAEETRERSIRDIEAAKNQAIGEIHEQTVYLATTVAEKILRKNLNAEDQRDLVKRSLDQLQGINRG